MLGGTYVTQAEADSAARTCRLARKAHTKFRKKGKGSHF